MDDDSWLDAAEAARRLGVKPATLYAYVSRGVLTRRRGDGGRRSLFDPAEVAALKARAAPGLRDQALVFPSAVTALGADRPYYRGRDATVLAVRSTYEQVAEWLWAGRDGVDGRPWAAPSDAVAVARRVQDALPADTLALDRLQLAVATLGAMDPMRFNAEPKAVAATGRALVAGAVDALPARSRGSRAGTIAERLWPKLTAAPPHPDLVRALDAALVLLADHELAASTVAARVAASVRADPYAVVCAGLGVLGGPMHGGASLGAERLFEQMAGPSDAPRVIGERLREGERMPGIGHTVYRNGDARCGALLDLLRAAAPGRPRLAVADAALLELEQRSLPPANVDFALATLTGVCEMAPGSGEAIFAVARTAGWLAHALEEYARRKPLRPRADYYGPPMDADTSS